MLSLTLVTAGFLFLNALVILLGASSTARYDFERNRVRQEERSAGDAAAGAVAAPTVPAVSGDGREEQEPQRSVAVSVAAHPAGKGGGPGSVTGWWLVANAGAVGRTADAADEAADRVVAGPFPDRTEAEWAALSGGLDAVPVHGVRHPSRGLVRKPCPQDRAWLEELGTHLDRLSEDWDELVSDSDPLTTLVVELTAVLVESGVSLRDGTGESPAGGVCLTPVPSAGGILLSWQPHDRMSMHQVRGAAVDAAVQTTLNAAVADLLAQLGFAVEPFGATGCHLVRG
jgi:hypothetical protein